MVIWKYHLAIRDNQDLSMPAGAIILSVANQNETLCMWAMCDPSKKLQRRAIEIIGTGNPIPGDVNRTFIGTAVVNPFVWHVFERT